MKIMFLLWLSSSHWLASGGDKVPPDSEEPPPTDKKRFRRHRPPDFSAFLFSFHFFLGSSAFEGVKKWGAMWWAVVVAAWSPPFGRACGPLSGRPPHIAPVEKVATQFFTQMPMSACLLVKI